MPTFRRDGFTWLAYWMLTYYAVLQANVGTIIPFLRSELTLSFTVAGFHTAAFALGMILAGMSTQRLKQYLGRYPMFLVSGTGMALGTVLLITGRSEVVTIGGVFVMGYIGTWLLITINESLTDLHGTVVGVALTESNVVASVGATVMPFVIAGFTNIDLGWRAAFAIVIVSWVGLALLLRYVRVPSEKQVAVDTVTAATRKLPRPFWFYWVMFLFVISVEWSVIYWSAEFLVTVVGISPADSAAAVGLYFAGNIVSRLIFSRLTRYYPAKTLLLFAIFVSILGFPLFWLARIPALNIIGLFVVGFGVGGLYPLTQATAISIAGESADLANSRIPTAVGIAMLFVPQLLGSLADFIGLFQAYSIVIFLLAGSLGMWFVANNAVKKASITPDLSTVAPKP
jgi:MFS family permease